MNRTDLIQNFLKSIDSMARIGLMQQKDAARPKNMPPHGQMGVLFVLSHMGPLTVKDISQKFGMTSSAATQLVNALVKSGHVVRKDDKEDRRKIYLSLTAKGKKTITQAKELRMKKMIKMFEPLTDNEVEQLMKIQTKIVNHFENHGK